MQIAECPIDQGKLLIGYETGYCVLWNLVSKQADYRYRCHAGLTCQVWHFEGKQFMTGHTDGKIAVWNVRNQDQPQTKFNPHQNIKESEADQIRSGSKVQEFQIRIIIL